ncbi:MAG: DUF368 domain-containing protein [Ruminococcus sp.]|nr:DUF368 domain-containing protein [Ruminococcus sp.]MBQ8298198.1 DUF368 domain-containing protein [Ruminococcus sp.]
MEHIINVLKGVVIGIANAIPGVSGGTMMVIMKVFDRLMGAITLNLKKLKENFVFLLTIIIGLAIGVLLSAFVLDYCFSNFYVQTQFFFMGVVLGSLPMIYKAGTEDHKFKPLHIIPFLAGLAVIIAVTVVSLNIDPQPGSSEMSVGKFMYFVVALLISAAAMIMPGLSGSLVLLILGGYHELMQAIRDFDFAILLPSGIGIILGIVLCSKVITICLKKWKNGTYAVILGLIAGSFYAIWPRESFEYELTDAGIWEKVPTGAVFEMNSTGVIAIIIGIIGVLLPLSMELIDRKKKASAEK